MFNSYVTNYQRVSNMKFSTIESGIRFFGSRPKFLLDSIPTDILKKKSWTNGYQWLSIPSNGQVN